MKFLKRFFFQVCQPIPLYAVLIFPLQSLLAVSFLSCIDVNLLASPDLLNLVLTSSFGPEVGIALVGVAGVCLSSLMLLGFHLFSSLIRSFFYRDRS